VNVEVVFVADEFLTPSIPMPVGGARMPHFYPAADNLCQIMDIPYQWVVGDQVESMSTHSNQFFIYQILLYPIGMNNLLHEWIHSLVENKSVVERSWTNIKDKKYHLVLDMAGEGIIDNHCMQCLAELVIKYPYLKGNITYMTSSLNGQLIFNDFCKNTRGVHVEDIQILPLSGFEFSFPTTPFTREPDAVFTKKFICLNRSNKMHRSIVFAFLVTSPGLLDVTHLSMVIPDFGGPMTFTDSINHFNRQNHSQRYIFSESVINTTILMLPRRLDSLVSSNYSPTGSEIEQYYKDSLFNITTESMYFDAVENGISKLFITEKTLKVFNYCQIPIMVGCPGIVDYLRNSGYDVFDDIVNHSYDHELDPVRRLIMIFDEVTRIDQKYSLADCRALHLNLYDRFKHNKELLVSKGSLGLQKNKTLVMNWIKYNASK
jgi:hypothetical protein